MAVRSKNAQATVLKNEFYIDGTSVRRMSAVPKEAPQEPVRRRDWERIEEEEREERRVRRQRREQQRALSYSKAYVIFLSFCICVMFLVCGCYLYLQSTMATNLDTIRNLENQIIDLKADNDETMQRLDASLDLEAIQEKAMNELGMVYPRSTQIVTYSVDESDTMTQYAEVP